MKMKLSNQTRGTELAQEVELARSFVERTRGLLGRSSLESGRAMWIQGTRFVACNSIHTFFMRFAIDVVFVDRDLKVCRVYRALPPWRMTLPAANAYSVFELPAGALSETAVSVGDQLHVGY